MQIYKMNFKQFLREQVKWAVGPFSKDAIKSYTHREDFTIIYVDPAEVIAETDPDMRVDSINTNNRIGSRFQNAVDHLKSKQVMDLAVIAVDRYSSNARIVIDDGRHRLAAAKSLNLKSVPVYIMKSDFADIKKILNVKKTTDTLSEGRYTNYIDKSTENDAATEFMNRYGGNIFPIKGKNKTVNFTWTIHSMSRFLERDINPKKVQSLLEKIALQYDEIKSNTKFLVYSTSLDQAIVISKNTESITILTVYPPGASSQSRDTIKVVLESEQLQRVEID